MDRWMVEYERIGWTGTSRAFAGLGCHVWQVVEKQAASCKISGMEVHAVSEEDAATMLLKVIGEYCATQHTFILSICLPFDLNTIPMRLDQLVFLLRREKISWALSDLCPFEPLHYFAMRSLKRATNLFSVWLGKEMHVWTAVHLTVCLSQ
jgi:hypothetical protein